MTQPLPDITRIDFKVGNVDRKDNKVSGKRKNKFLFSCAYGVLYVYTFVRGAQKLLSTSTLCVVHCKSGVNYPLKRYFLHMTIYSVQSCYLTLFLYSCIKGSLIEMNEQLLSDPTLLQTQVLAVKQPHIATTQY